MSLSPDLVPEQMFWNKDPETRHGPKVGTIFGPFFALGSAGLLIYLQGHRELFRGAGILKIPGFFFPRKRAPRTGRVFAASGLLPHGPAVPFAT